MDANTSQSFILSARETGKILPWLSQLQSVSLGTIFLTLFLAVLTPSVFTSLYRLYFHPLRKIPGPRTAALTSLYGFYWNWIRDEGYSKLFNPLHKRYDSCIIRIGPNHVHINQPETFDEIFKAGSTWRKDNSFYKHFNGLDAMIEPTQYRTYRTHLAPLYAQRSIDGLTPKLHDDLVVTAERMAKSIGNSEPVNMVKILRTLSDITLSEYDGYHPFLEAFELLMTQSWLMVNYPMMGMILGLIPGTSFARFNAAFGTFLKYCKEWNDEDERIQKLETAESLRDSHMKRYLAIDINDEIKKKVVPHPLEDIFNFIAGGSDTTSYTAACAFFYVLSSSEVYSNLVAELDQASSVIKDTFDYKKIQNLPYLNAVIKETLRISCPVPGCIPRVVPEGGMNLGSVNLPAGTVVSISQLAIHFNETIFPSPDKFIPERWLGDDNKSIDKWNIAFSRGPRQCIGTTLAYMELRCVLAYFFSRFELKSTGSCGDKLRWVDRFVSVNLDDIEVTIVKDRWT
ncbi:elymoclavine monooxygenase [Epichloe bromicola]